MLKIILILINKALKSKGLYDIEATHSFDKLMKKIYSSFSELKLQKKYINKIKIVGNSITKDKTLRSKIEVEPGDIYSEFRIKKDADAIKNLKYINNAKAVSKSTK